MRENVVEVLTGAAVLVVAAAFLFFAAGNAGPSVSGGQYPLTASFSSVEGIAVGSDVRMGGVKVGTVTDITLNPENFRADMTVAVSEQFQLPDDSSILISSEGLLGGSFVEIQPGGSPFNLEPGDAFSDTQGAVGLITLLLRVFGGEN